MNVRKNRFFGSILLFTFLFAVISAASPAQSAAPKPEKDSVLKASDIKPKLFPESVFFRGQTAPTQMRLWRRLRGRWKIRSPRSSC